MTTMYFKGGKGIENPVDVNGASISEGDILTHDYYCDFYQKHYPEMTEEYKTRPFYRVKKHKDGYYYAESDEFHSSTLFYLHDFRFKYTKKI